MNPDDKTLLRVGATVLILIILGVGATVAFSNVRLTSTVRFHIHFGHMAGLEEGAEVYLAGKQVGQVMSLRLVPANSIDETHPLYPEGGVTADVLIDWWYAKRAAVNGEYFVSSLGILGKSYIEVGPPANNEPVLRNIERGDEVRGIDPPILDRALYRALRNLDASREFLEDLAPEASALAEQLEQFADNADAVLPDSETWDRLVADTKSSSAELGALIDGTGDLRKLDDVLTSGRRTVRRAADELNATQQRISALRDEVSRVSRMIPPDMVPKFKRVKKQFDRNLDRVSKVVANAQALLAIIDSGEGTIGAIAQDPEFSDDARDLGKLMKRQPWKVFGHPGNKRPKFGKPPVPPDM